MQLKTTVLSSYLAVRVDAFNGFLVALENWSNNKSVAACAGVYRAANLVYLVASEETIDALNEVQEAVAMRADLLTYQAPEIRLKANHKERDVSSDS